MGGASEWCPNPASTISLRVKGNSMSPLIFDSYLLAVDTSETAHEKMLGQIVVAWIRDEKRLLVSRLIRFDHTDALISGRRENQAVVRRRIQEAHCGSCALVDRQTSTIALESASPTNEDSLLILKFHLE